MKFESPNEKKRAYRKYRYEAAQSAREGCLESELQAAVQSMVRESGMPVAHVAKLTKVSTTVLYAIMANRQPVTSYGAQRIAEALGYEWAVQARKKAPGRPLEGP